MENERDELAQVGIGAMIVFIGALLAVTSSAYVMIQGLERITQTTQETVSVATKEAHTQIIFVGGWVDDHFDDYSILNGYQTILTLAFPYPSQTEKWKGKGYGTLLFRINTTGKFQMFGDFSVVSGSYSFKYGGLIGKKFVSTPVPTGKEICQNQLFKLIDKVHDIEVNETEINDFLPFFAA